MNLVERVKAIILTPKTEWPVIERESGDVGYLFQNYVAILAAIPAVAGLVGAVMSGLSMGTAVMLAVVQYVLAFVAAYLIGMLINLLAPRFGGREDFGQALKLSVYSSTPSWLAGVFALIPALSFLAILGLYGIYLLYTGAGPLMRVPQERSLGFTITVVVCAILLMLVLGFVTAALVGIPGV
ncbi:MAG: YIP1 family protein [Xanthobacteraceae bacterium]|nr:YIP1 family protein [Xanthobacteraceae bacterium]